LRKRSYVHVSERPPPEPEIEGADPIGKAVLEALDEIPFASLRQLAKRTLILVTTIRYHLVISKGYKLNQCKKVPHKLSAAKKRIQVTISRSLLNLLQSIRHNGCQHLVTLDEAWFYFANQDEQIWLPDFEDHREIPGYMISSPKSMLTVVWNPHGFYMVNVLPKGQRWASQYDLDNILPGPRALREAGDPRRLVIHADNANPHILKPVQQFFGGSRAQNCTASTILRGPCAM
jgi:hypothetical protein